MNPSFEVTKNAELWISFDSAFLFRIVLGNENAYDSVSLIEIRS